MKTAPASLAPTAPETDLPKTPTRPDRATQISQIKVDLIFEGTHNPRIAGAEDKDGLAMLAADMREQGQLQPIGVAENPDGNTFTVVWGSRRLKAAKINGWETISCIQVDERDFDRDRAAASENLHRRPMTPLEELISVERLIDRNSHQPETRRIDMAAAILGRSATWVRDRLYLKRLSAKNRERLMEGVIDLAQARQLAKIPDAEAQDEFVKRHTYGIGLSPAEHLADYINRSMQSLNLVPWRLDAPDIVKGLPPCTTCPHNSDNDKTLFEHDTDVRLGPCKWQDGKHQYQSGAHCTNSACFEKKSKAVQVTIERQAQTSLKAAKVGPATKLKPAELKAITTSAAAAVPAFIKPEAVKARVEAELASKTQKPTGQLSDHAREKREREARRARAEADKARRDRQDAIAKHLAKTPGASLLIWMLGNLGWTARNDLADARGSSKGSMGYRVRKYIKAVVAGELTIAELEEMIADEMSSEFGKSAYQKAQEVYSAEARAEMDRLLLPEELWTGLAAKGPKPTAAAEPATGSAAKAKNVATAKKGGKGK